MVLRRDMDPRNFLLNKDRTGILGMLSRMEKAVEKMVGMAVSALETCDQDMARQVVDGDETVDEYEIEIEQECLRIIAVRQPVREELRFYFSVLKIITDLERMADEACNIAKHITECGSELLPVPSAEIRKMASLSMGMLRDGLKSFEESDPELAKRVFLEDDEIDALFEHIGGDLLTVVGSGKPGDAEVPRRAVLLQLVARHLERIGDHAANISERSFYMSTGKRIKKELPMR